MRRWHDYPKRSRFELRKTAPSLWYESSSLATRPNPSAAAARQARGAAAAGPPATRPLRGRAVTGAPAAALLATVKARADEAAAEQAAEDEATVGAREAVVVREVAA